MIYDHKGDLNMERGLVPHVTANFVAVSSVREGGNQVTLSDSDDEVGRT